MREVLAKVDALLQEAGTSKARILNTTLVLDDIRDFESVNVVWDSWVDKENAPARSTLEGRLATKGLLVELIVVAAI
jgi:enamine deaminase RidA (YjgF/YER057c/UK114 family)